MSTASTYSYPKQFKLESGKKIRNLQIAYQTYGKLNTKKDNVIWVCHALTANADVFEWWKVYLVKIHCLIRKIIL